MSSSPLTSNFVPAESRMARAIYVGCVTVFLTSLGCWALLAHQDSPVAQRLRAQERASPEDQRFARTAAEEGIAEIRFSELAQSRGSSQTVRAFGKRLIDLDTAAADQLRAAAAKENISIPTEMSPRDQGLYDMLSKANGRQFDTAYAESIVEIHERNLQILRQEAKSGKNEKIRTYAAQRARAGEEQLDQARRMLVSVTP